MKCENQLSHRWTTFRDQNHLAVKLTSLTLLWLTGMLTRKSFWANNDRIKQEDIYSCALVFDKLNDLHHNTENGTPVHQKIWYYCVEYWDVLRICGKCFNRIYYCIWRTPLQMFSWKYQQQPQKVGPPRVYQKNVCNICLIRNNRSKSDTLNENSQNLELSILH